MEQKILNFKIISSVNKPHALLLVKSIIKAVSIALVRERVENGHKN